MTGVVAPGPVPLLRLRNGLPDVVDDASKLADVVEAFAATSGPVAIDAERASGYRYTHRAYLIQVRRDGAGTALIDPIACPDLTELAEVLSEAEWVLHAANQDIPSLAEVGLRPPSLFDTELAARLLGYPKVGLAALVENVLGFVLEKGHSAADWSTRPLPEPWLRYAALDVEPLIELRDVLDEQLREAGKLRWAQEEFAALVAAPVAEPRAKEWRRTSGLHRVKKRRELAIVRAVWEERDRIARDRDVAPGRVLPDAAIIEIALAARHGVERLATLPALRARHQGRNVPRWQQAVTRAMNLPEAELPEATVRYDGPPPARTWAARDPVAAARLTATRAAVAEVAEEHQLPVENLLTPDTLRRVTWRPPQEITPDTVAAALRERSAREWQVRLTAAPIAQALVDAG